MIRRLLAVVLASFALGAVVLGDGRRDATALVLGLLGIALCCGLWADEDGR